MPRWICPYCEHVTEVTPLVIGHAFSCPGCQEESTVIDADAEQIGKLRLEKALETANSQGLRSVSVANIILGVLAAGMMLFCLFTMIMGGVPGFLLGGAWFVGIVIFVSVATVVLEGINEIHRCRKLLEELLRKRG